MRHKSLALFLVLIVGLLSFGVVAAQDATATPVSGENVAVEYALNDVIGNKDQYYGQEITTEGTIEDLVNVRAFVLGEGATVGDGQLLVINNSDATFDLAIKNNQRVRLTGTLYPSFNDGGWDQLAGANTVNGTALMATQDMMMATPMATEMMMATPMATEMMMATPMATEMMGSMVKGAVDLSQMYIPDNLRDHTILVLNSLDTITYIQTQ
ncbi:MAG: hypothetical protein ABI700_26570 [Chloroflexota bacterium]